MPFCCSLDLVRGANPSHALAHDSEGRCSSAVTTTAPVGFVVMFQPARTHPGVIGAIGDGEGGVKGKWGSAWFGTGLCHCEWRVLQTTIARARVIGLLVGPWRLQVLVLLLQGGGSEIERRLILCHEGTAAERRLGILWRMGSSCANDHVMEMPCLPASNHN